MKKIYLFLLLSSFLIGFKQTPVIAESNSLIRIAERLQMISCPELTGYVIFPHQSEYDQARLTANYYYSKNKFPNVIVYCQTTQDVQNAVRWARCYKMPIRVRSGGHHHLGSSSGTGTIVIDVSEMKHIQINPSAKIAIVQPGLNNRELYSALYEKGLTHVGGTCSDVSISGLILTGGMGPLLRREGLGCDQVIELEIVDANGKIIRANKNNEYKDLFWACLGGGGGNFGVVTSIAIKVYPAEPVTWFNIGWDWDQPVEEIISAWQEFFLKDDKRWFSHLDIWSKSFPGEELDKHPLKALGFFFGTPQEARQELAPLLKIGKHVQERIEKVNWAEAIREIEESTAVFLTSKPEYKSTGAFAMQKLPPKAIKEIVKTLSETPSSLFNVLLFSLGGVTAEISPTETAYFYRKAQFFINYSIQWLLEKNDKNRINELDTLRKNLLPYTTGDYVGNPDPVLHDYLTDYYGENARRLQCIKRKYDPHNLFRFSQSIPPAPLIWKCVTEK